MIESLNPELQSLADINSARMQGRVARFDDPDEQMVAIHLDAHDLTQQVHQWLSFRTSDQSRM